LIFYNQLSKAAINYYVIDPERLVEKSEKYGKEYTSVFDFARQCYRSSLLLRYPISFARQLA